MIRRYHFAYYVERSGGYAMGNYHADADGPIRSERDLESVCESIQAAFPGNGKVVILSWRRFEEPEASDG